YHLDRGNVVQAALCFERVLAQEKPEKLPAMTLVKAALAYRRAGDTAKADQTWRLLARAAGRDGVRINGRAVSLDELQQEINSYATVEAPASPYDWAMYKGNASRSASGNGSAPFLEAKWTYPTFQESQTGQWIDQAVKQRESRQDAVLPAFFPVAATVRSDKGSLPLLIYRSHWGVHARDLSKDGKLAWDSPSSGSLDSLVADQEKKMQLDQWQWVQLYMNTNSNFLFENSTIGTLSTDNKYVYIVDDLALPPHPS